jgi:phosphatidate phosphatase LPIN
MSADWPAPSIEKPHTDELLPLSARNRASTGIEGFHERQRQSRSMTPTLDSLEGPSTATERSASPPPLPTKEAIERAIALSRQLSASNIPSQVTETGDLMLDMTGYKSSDDDALRAEVIARKILSEELEGNYDIGALIGADEHGNLWIYSSEEAKEAASQRAIMAGITTSPMLTSDAASDPGYHSDEGSERPNTPMAGGHRRADSESGPAGLETPPNTPPDVNTAGDPNRNYAKTLRLTSDQLRALNLQPGANSMSFTVNRATCQARMYLWKYNVPVVISDIDGTITKSDALGHVLNMIGRDWTHIGVAKLYTEIVANGYNIMYLTSRSVGQADTTRAYLNGVVQENYRLPQGPTIMSPDRTIAALRREIYLRKPEVFKMACLRDIKNLFGPTRSPFYAGFGNRLTDALSYRSVSIPSNRIFTINSNAEVSLDLLSLNKLKLSYVNMREVVDHYFPPVATLVEGGGEEFTDFRFWRDEPLELDAFSASEDEDDENGEEKSEVDEDDEEGDEDEEDEAMRDSYISRDSFDDGEAEGADMENSMLSGSVIDEDIAEEDIDEEDVDEEEEYVDEDIPEEDEIENEDALSLAAVDEEDEALTPGPNEHDVQASELHHSASEAHQEDFDAEIVTGVKGLSVQRDSPRKEGSSPSQPQA